MKKIKKMIKNNELSDYQGNWSGNFFGGKQIKKLEYEWSNHFNAKHSIACNSATSGIWMALNAIGLKKDEEVIVTPYSMTCSATIPLLFNAIPVFADIEEDYFCIDPNEIEKKITEKTKAIIAVNLFGQPCDWDEINKIAKKYSIKYNKKIYTIEDNAQAPGATYRNVYTGTLGDIGVFSLNRHKIIQAGEGGICCTNDEILSHRLRLSMNHGESVINDMVQKDFKVKEEEAILIGMNLRMTEIQALISRKELKNLYSRLENLNNDYYFDFKDKIKVRENCLHSFYRYAVKSKEKCEEKLFKNYNFKKHYITPLYKLPVFKLLKYDQNQCKICEEVDEKIILFW